MFSFRLCHQKLVFLLFLLLLGGCTPALNWREVRLESNNGAVVKAMLPCKPDQATRKQQLADIQVELSMMGCQSKDMTFTLSQIPLHSPLEASKVLMAWQLAGSVNVQAEPVQALPTTTAGASAWPSASRATLRGKATDAQMLWFARQTDKGVTLYQAALYGKQISGEAVNTFFESLQVQ